MQAKGKPRRDRQRRTASLDTAVEHKPVQGTDSPQQPVDLGSLRKEITNRVAEHALTIVETAIDQAENGHSQAMKYLFEMIGLFPATGAEEASQDDGSLAKILADHLGIADDPTLGFSTTKTNVASVPAQSHAVK